MKKRKILSSILGVALGSIIAVTPVYADNIPIILKNFKQERYYHGESKYLPVIEEGIPAREHILIVKEAKYMDDATDTQGNEYHFYMVDEKSGLKALVTLADLEPEKELEGYVEEFVRLVEKEIEKDGGVEAIVDKFSKCSECCY